MSYGRIVFAVVAASAASACTTFTPPQERPVIEEGLRMKNFLAPASVGVLSMTPERRVVLHNFENKRSCAEGPTEIGVDLSSVAKLIANVAISGEKKVDALAAIARASGNTILNKRTQAMQFYLAASYSLCQMYLNGAIKEESLLEQQAELIGTVATLLAMEVPLFYEYLGKSDVEKAALSRSIPQATLDQAGPDATDLKAKVPAPAASAASASAR